MTYGKISKKQQEILEYIKSEILNRGFPPAVREICEAVNLKSTSSVHAHLEALEKNGYIVRTPMENDARLKRIELTQKALDHENRVRENIRVIEDAMHKGFSKEEFDMMLGFLDRVIDNMEELNM